MIIRRILSVDRRIYRGLRLRALELAPDAFGSRFDDAKQLPDEEWRKRVTRFATDAKAVNFLAFDGDVALGMVSCFITDKAEMVQMWVEPSARGARVGEGLIDSLIEWLRASAVTKVYAEVYESNSAAFRLYEKTGFSVVERIEDPAAEPAKRVELRLMRMIS